MACHCPMIDCDNGSYRLQNGKLNFAKFTRFHTSLCCSCQPPFSLHPHPTHKKNPAQAFFSPARVCSQHFLDGTPTAENSFPTQNLGYPGFQLRTARVPIDIPRPEHRLGRRKWAMRDLEFQFETCQAQGSSRERNGAAS
ncbi:uncharacterized protein [Littorina saxatilis]|uniref:uncharacterized protein n=1 Tax=Littorina saxatilis TaxID=31220 RepID=UPI0038B5C97E